MSQDLRTDAPANAYQTKLATGRRHWLNAIAAIGLLASVIAGLLTDGPTLWGLLRSSDLKSMLITGWMMLVPACVMYAGILLATT